MRFTRICAVLIAVSLFALGAFAAAPDDAKTVANLQAAYNGESNAHARYLEFAKKADSEGYGEVASLFRAAARAEEVHAGNHAVVIKKLGATPTAKIETPVVKTTKENLEAAIKGETYERDNMYPEFIQQAKAVRNIDAVRTFNLAKTAEAEHARLYTEAVNNLPKLKGTKTKDYFVCSICGFTATKIDFTKCPSCFEPKEKYTSVS
jgi:rubrerythrin